MAVFQEELKEDMQVREKTQGPALTDFELVVIKSIIEKGSDEIIGNLYKNFIVGVMRGKKEEVGESLNQFINGVLMAENIKKIAIQAIEATTKEQRK